MRDWLYVTDHCAAIWTIMQQGQKGRTYNVGGRNEMQNIRVVEVICDLLDELAGPLAGKASRRALITYVKDRPGHDQRYAIDPTRVRLELGWKPSVTLDQGLEMTVDWFLGNESWWRALENRDGVGKRLGSG